MVLSTKNSVNDKLKQKHKLIPISSPDLDDQSHDVLLDLDQDHDHDLEVVQQVEAECGIWITTRNLTLDNGPMMPISRRTMKSSKSNKGVEVGLPKPRSLVWMIA
jgi:hypothetical protein